MPSTVAIRPEDRTAIQTLLFEHVATTTAQRKVLGYLFEHTEKPASASDIAESEPDAPPNTKDNVRAMVLRLRLDLDAFFKSDDGRKLAIRVVIPHGRGYRLQFQRNGPDSARGLVAEFWRQYIGAVEPVLVLYPEPLFFRDQQHTYFRNPAVSHVEEFKKKLSYLKLKGDVTPNNAFVPAGIVQGMLFLLETFHRLDIPYRTSPITPFMTMGDVKHEHLVVLGTPSTNPLIATLEDALPMRTTTGGIECELARGRKAMFRDDAREDLTGSKWALLTRKEHILRGSFVTVLAAEHGRTVQALAQFLTREADLASLTEKLDTTMTFPDRFQALFEVHMSRTEAEPHADWIEVNHAVRGGTFQHTKEVSS
jgi:hypothetical protein